MCYHNERRTIPPASDLEILSKKKEDENFQIFVLQMIIKPLMPNVFKKQLIS